MLAWPREGRETGPGRVSQLLRTQPGDRRYKVIDDYWLWNFNFDGNIPKHEHEGYLLGILKTLHARPCHVEISGYADKRGDPAYNQTLSASRALMVKDWFLRHNVPESQVPGTRMTAHGEVFSQHTKEFAKTDKEKDAFWRAVNVQVHVGVLNRGIPMPEPESPKDPTIYIDWWQNVIIGTLPRYVPPPPPSQDKPSSKWSYKFLEGIETSGSIGFKEASMGVGMKSCRILWYNHETGMHHVGRFTGHGGNVSPNVPMPDSGEGLLIVPNGTYTFGAEGWTTVNLDRARTWRDFEGDATWHDPALYGTSELRPKGFDRPLEVPTGMPVGTYGLGSNPVSKSMHRGMLNMTPGFTGVEDRP